jgi:hypothetical protein
MGVAGFRTAAERASADGGPAACSFVHLHATSRKPMRQLLKNTFTLALALIFTAGMAFGQTLSGDDNEATINQVGPNNEANTDQVGANNTSTTVQNGVENFANLDQGSQFSFGGNVSTFPGNDATIRQIGNLNYVNLQQGGANRQDGTGAGSEATIVLEGNKNVFGVRSRGVPPFDADVDLGTALQVNKGQVIQKASKIDVNVDGNRNRVGFAGGEHEFSNADIDLVGNDNKVGVFAKSFEARGRRHDADVDAVGDGNVVDIYQGNFGEASNNDATIDIDGSLNQAQIGQGVGALAFPAPTQITASDNVATITMNGNGNRATINQNGGQPPQSN